MGKRKMTARKSIAMLLVLAMIALCFPASAFATGTEGSGDAGTGTETPAPVYQNGEEVLTGFGAIAGIAEVEGTDIEITVPYLYPDDELALSSASLTYDTEKYQGVSVIQDGTAVIDGAAITIEVGYMYAADENHDLYTTTYTVRVVRTAKVDATFSGAIAKTLNAAYTFTAADFTAKYSQNDGKALSQIQFVGSQPTWGKLTLNGTDVDSGAAVALADIAAGKLVFTPAEDAVAANHTFFLKAYDADNLEVEGTVSLNIEYTADTTIDPFSGGTIDQGAALKMETLSGIFQMEFSALAEEDLVYVTFTPPTNGTLYRNFSSVTAPGTAITATDKCYVTPASGQVGLKTLAYVPKNAGSVSLEYKAYGASGTEYTGSVSITVKEVASTLTDVTLSVDRGGYVTMSGVASTINSYYRNLTGNNMAYVTFTLPASSLGTMKSKYSGGYNLAADNKCYYVSTSGQIYLNDVVFQPYGSVTAQTFPLGYTAYDANGANPKTGVIKVTINVRTNNPSFSLTMAQDEYEDLDPSEFYSEFYTATGKALKYIQFTSLPNTNYGTLYQDYSPSSSASNTRVSTYTSYYYSGGTPLIGDVTFVPGTKTGTCTISYRGCAADNSYYNGTITVYISAASTELGTITYEMRKGGFATLKKSDFTTAFANNGAGTLSHIKFNLPSSTYGYLNYNYTHSNGHYDSRVSSSAGYYLNESLYLEKISFVPKAAYTGTVTIGYKAYNTSGNYYEGKVRFIVGTNSGQLDPIDYTINQGETVTFVNSDLNEVFKDLTDKNFSYVKFTQPSSNYGTLYYDYLGSKKAVVSSSTAYNRSTSPYFREVTFVPAAGYSGTVDIRYTAFDAYDNGYSGTISVEVKAVSTQKTLSTLTYSIKNTDVLAFPVSYIESLVKQVSTTGYGLSYVTVTPVVNAYGGLYYGYLNSTNKGSLVTSSTTKYYRSGDPSAAKLYLVPSATYAGTFYLEYTAYDLGGAGYNGKIAITLSGAQTPKPPVTPTEGSAYFTDVNANYKWAAEAIDYLYTQNVVTGTGGNNYSPAANIKRGDFILMLYRAFDLSATTSGNFKDVPSSKYYAQAIAVAKALGIAKGGDDGKFNPEANLSRQDACVLLDRTLDVVKKSLPDGTSANLSAIKDKSSIASYATGSVATLVKAEVITGYTDKTFRPKGNLTRAEMAVILYRVLK